MQPPHFPVNETERMAALHAAYILDTPAEEAFDRITRLVAHTLDVPIALISLIDGNRQWFKSKVGVDINETSRDISFCGHALLEGAEFIITDAKADVRFFDNPFVTGPANIRFYAGIPLRSVEGYPLGTLCSVDHIPRDLTDAQLAVLHDLASIAEELIQQRQLAFTTKSLLNSLQERETRYRNLIERSPDAFLIHTDGVVTFANDTALALLGAEKPEQVIGISIMSFVTPEYLNIAKQRFARSVVDGLDTPLLEQEWFRMDGSRIFVEATSIPFSLGDARAVQIIARDITERKLEQRELERLATNDILTGLPNRTLLMDRLRQGISRWERHEQKALIVFIGLDHFKHINDSFGSGVGDQALIAVAKNLMTLLRQSDTAARIGGDEFVLILEDMRESQIPPTILQRIFEHVSHPIWIGGQEISIASSVGFSIYPDDGTDVDTLLNASNAAMYRAKSIGRSNIQQFEKEMRLHANERFALENQLKHAVENHELLLHYQPKLDLISGRITGVEALVRWQHPKLGLVSPARFIPAAEESGLIVPIGEWILITACEQLKKWQDMGITNVSMAINLSGLQFLQHDIVGCVKRAIEHSNVNANLLEFELTESMSMGNPEKSVGIMRQFKALGVSLSIDDFGTGYSNLSYLKRFPVDTLKIDQSFVSDMSESVEALAIVKAIISMAHSLHLTVVAEGVETSEQLRLLVENQCDLIQGFYFSKPLVAEDCTEFILSGSRLVD